MKQLEGLAIQQRYVEHMGCLKGCLEYLRRDVSFPWLYGGTGHAFIIVIDEHVDVSSPYVWDTSMLFDLAPNLGAKISGFAIWKHEAGDAFSERQREAWDFVRANIDHGLPCYGWELVTRYGGYWVITGYDEVGYYYSGSKTGGPLPWQQLGDQFVPLLEVRRVEPCEPAPPEVAVARALTTVLARIDGPEAWTEEQAYSGAAAYAYWAEALETGEAKRDDHTYNATLWLECRQMAAAFLREVKERLPGRCDAALDEAIARYETVCRAFEAVTALHAPRDKADWSSRFSSPEAAELVRQVGAADARAIEALHPVLAALA